MYFEDDAHVIREEMLNADGLIFVREIAPFGRNVVYAGNVIHHKKKLKVIYIPSSI